MSSPSSTDAVTPTPANFLATGNGDDTPQPVTPEQAWASLPPTESDNVEKKVDKLDDIVTSVAQPVLAVQALYETHADAIHQALAGLANYGAAGAVVSDWVGVADKVVDGLDGLAKSQPFPFVGVAVFLIKGVIQLEVQRRQNSKRSRALILQMADMLSALLQLHFIRDPELVDPSTGQSISGRIQTLLKNIEEDIKSCGNLIDTYHKHSITSKFFFSGSYADKFKAQAEALVARKADIVYALQIHTAVTVDAIHAEVRASNAMLTKLMTIVDKRSERDVELDRTLRDLGGRSKVLGNDELLTTMASAIQSRSASKSSPGSAVADGEKFSGKERAVLSATERHELRQPLETVLKENAAYYAHKLEAQIDAISHQIDKLNDKSEQILRTVTGGAWERIRHADLAAIWKENGWHSSVESRIFVMAIHDYYFDLFARGGESATPVSTYSLGKDTRSSSLSTDGDIVTSDPLPISTLDAVSVGVADQDKWCLEYLTVRYSSSIMEAFDADASGFVRVAELNYFCTTIPKGLTLLQWLAYWTCGWKQEACIYAHLTIGLLKQMRDLLQEVLLMNNRHIQLYFQAGTWVRDLNTLLYAAATKFVPSLGTPLDALVKAEMQRKELIREQVLKKLFYALDTPESLALVCDTGSASQNTKFRLESEVLPITFQLLRHHAGVIQRAKTTILDEREFALAADTLGQVMREVRFRIDNLEAGCTQMGLDHNTLFTHFAGGLYEHFHSGDIVGDPDDVFDEDFADDVESTIVASAAAELSLRYGVWHLDLSGYEEQPKKSDADNLEQPDSPISPIFVTPATDLGVTAETYVRRVIIRLESLTSDARFRFIKPVMHVFRAVAQSEQNLRRQQLSRALIVQVANMLNAMLKIRTLENLTLTTDSGESVLGRMQVLARKIERDVNDCGHLIHSLHAQNMNMNVLHRGDLAHKFKDRASGIERRTQDITDALALPPMKGIARFRAIVRVVIFQIKDMRRRWTWAYFAARRDQRRAYVGLVAKQLQAAETRTIWRTNISLTPIEAQQLELIASDMSAGDWAYYQSLAKRDHRQAWVHVDRKCDSCLAMPIYGERYLCTVCTNFDLCPACEQKWSQLNNQDLPKNTSHSVLHPLLKISRPIIKLDKYAFAGLQRVHARLLSGIPENDSDSSDSSIYFSDEDVSENDTEVDTATPPSSTIPLPSNLNSHSKTPSPHASPLRKPWSFSEVEEQAQNIAPWEPAPTLQMDVEDDGCEHNGNSPKHIESPVNAIQLQQHWLFDGTLTGEAPTTKAASSGQPPILLLPRRSSTGATSMPELASKPSPPLALTSKVFNDVGMYRCVRCKERKSGSRFVMTREHRGKQLCIDCERKLAWRHNDSLIPDYLRLLLKCTLPEPALPLLSHSSLAAKVTPPSVAEENNKLQEIEARLRKMEGRVESLLGLIERERTHA